MILGHRGTGIDCVSLDISVQTSLECATYRGRFVNDGHDILISEQRTELSNFEFYRIEQNCVEAFSHSVRLCMIMCST